MRVQNEAVDACFPANSVDSTAARVTTGRTNDGQLTGLSFFLAQNVLEQRTKELQHESGRVKPQPAKNAMCTPNLQSDVLESESWAVEELQKVPT